MSVAPDFRRLAVAGAILIGIGIAPLLAMIGAYWIASSSGCALGEGVHPCRLFGHDAGDLLYAIDGLGSVLKISVWVVPIGMTTLVIALIKWLKASCP